VEVGGRLQVSSRDKVSRSEFRARTSKAVGGAAICWLALASQDLQEGVMGISAEFLPEFDAEMAAARA
jgi:hypothetical protein